MKRLIIPVKNQEYKVLFPERCMMCGAPSAEKRSLTLMRSAGFSLRGAPVSAQLLAPYCAEHAGMARSARRVSNILFWTSLAGALVLTGLTLTAFSSPDDNIISICLPAFFFFAFLFLPSIFLLHLLGMLVYPPLRRMPLPSQQGDLGLRADLVHKPESILLRFENEEIARAVAELNHVGYTD